MSKLLVGLVSLGIFIGILIFDLCLYLDGVPGNSVTQTIIYYSGKTALVPFFIGFLMGFLGAHFFDNYKEPRNPSKKRETW